MLFCKVFPILRTLHAARRGVYTMSSYITTVDTLQQRINSSHHVRVERLWNGQGRLVLGLMDSHGSTLVHAFLCTD